MAALRVAVVCGAYRPSADGVSDYIRRLSGALAARGIETEVVDAESWGVRGAAGAARALRRLRPHLVHVQFTPPAFGYQPGAGLLPPLLRAAGWRGPVVTTVHEYGTWAWPERLPERLLRAGERAGWWDRDTQRLLPASARVVVTNPGHAALVARRWRRRAELIPIGPNVEPAPGLPAPAQVRGRYAVPPEAPLLLFFGFVHPVKGLRYLIEALARARATTPGAPLARARLVVAGGLESLALPGGEARSFAAELAGQVRAAGLEGAVRLTGHLPDREVSALMSAADLVVLPFTGGVTTKSGSLLSALAHGRPTVVTRADPPDPALVDGRTVVVADGRRDAPALLAALRRALDDEHLRAQVSAGGLALAAAHGWDRIAARHAQLYRGVLAPAHPPTPRREAGRVA